MNQYVTGSIIKKLRESRNMTQAELAEKLKVSDKAISKWETAKGYPDITLIEPLAKALGISTIELFSGTDIINRNRASHMLRTKLYVCPMCGNVIHSVGAAVVSCCGITLPALEAEAADPGHELRVEQMEDEYYVTVDHPMEKAHFISFLAAVSDDGFHLVKLYPEGTAGARFKASGVRTVYCYCNQHGLFLHQIRKRPQEALFSAR